MYIYEFFKLDTILNQFLETGTSDRYYMWIVQRLRFSGFILYPVSVFLYCPFKIFFVSVLQYLGRLIQLYTQLPYPILITPSYHLIKYVINLSFKIFIFTLRDSKDISTNLNLENFNSHQKSTIWNFLCGYFLILNVWSRYLSWHL